MASIQNQKTQMRIEKSESGLSLALGDTTIATANIEVDSNTARAQIEQKIGKAEPFALSALIKVVLIHAEQNLGLSKVALSRNSEIKALDPDILKSFGFKVKAAQDLYADLNPSRGEKLRAAKEVLKNLVSTAPKSGRGFAIKNLPLDPSTLGEMLDEYSKIAWGFFGWARNAKPIKDELSVIESHVSGNVLEVGAGSGRISTALSLVADTLTITDYLPQIVEELKINFSGHKNIQVTLDNILFTKLPSNTFDVVTFWENGLGAMLNANDRIKALANMVRLAKPGGKIILSFRTLPQSPCEHLLYAAQTDDVVGIYHTFSREEIIELANLCQIRDCTLITDDSRPAGGNAVFLIGRK